MAMRSSVYLAAATGLLATAIYVPTTAAQAQGSDDALEEIIITTNQATDKERVEKMESRFRHFHAQQ